MRSSRAQVDDYIAALPTDRRATLQALRALIRKHLDPEIEEGMQYGMIGYYVPHRLFPAGYHVNPEEPLPVLALAAQKRHLALYLMHLYADASEAERFQKAWAASGKKLDMGKSCLRFQTLDDLALDVLGAALGRVSARGFVEQYERQRATAGGRPAAKKKTAAKPKRTKKAVTTKKTTARKKSKRESA